MSSLQDLLILLVAVAGSGSMIGLIAWFHSRLKRLEQTRGQEGEQLARDVEATRADMAQLAERLDFAERLLTRDRAEPDRIPRPPG